MEQMRAGGLEAADLKEVQLTGRIRRGVNHGSLAQFEQDVVNAQLAIQLRIQLHRDTCLRNGVATHATIICADSPCAGGPRRPGSGTGPGVHADQVRHAPA